MLLIDVSQIVFERMHIWLDLLQSARHDAGCADHILEADMLQMLLKSLQYVMRYGGCKA